MKKERSNRERGKEKRSSNRTRPRIKEEEMKRRKKLGGASHNRSLSMTEGSKQRVKAQHRAVVVVDVNDGLCEPFSTCHATIE